MKPDQILASRPQDSDHAPLLVDPAAARRVRAGEVAEGDVILAVVDERGQWDHVNEEYTARPRTYDPECECGVCCLLADEPGPVIVLTDDYRGSGACDPMPATTLLLVVPAANARS